MPKSLIPRFAWTRVVAEGVVIVTSILLALAVDQWWADRETRKAETEILTRLAEEFEANASQLDMKKNGHEKVLESGEALLQITGSSNRGRPLLDSLSSLVWDLLHTPTFDPEDGVLNSVISTGQLDIITDDDLRVALAGWPSLVRDLKEDENRAWDYVDQVIFPFMDRHVSFRTLHLSRMEDRFHRPSDFRSDAEELLRNREFENFIAGRITRVETIIEPLETLEEALSEIRAMLERELKR